MVLGLARFAVAPIGFPHKHLISLASPLSPYDEFVETLPLHGYVASHVFRVSALTLICTGIVAT